MSHSITSSRTRKSCFRCCAWLLCLTVAAVGTTVLAERVQAGFLLPEHNQDPSQTAQGASSQARDHWLLPLPPGSARNDPLQLATPSAGSQQDNSAPGGYQPVDAASLHSLWSSRHAARTSQAAGKLAVQAKVAKYPGSYGIDAMTNLSEWRGSLFQRTLDLQTRYLQASTVANETKGAVPNLKKDSMELWAPIVTCPPGMPAERVANIDPVDAAKWMCSLKQAAPPCVIYSLGSNNDFSFEDRMLETTPCSVHTFDCTVWGAARSRRSFFHKICIGKAPSDAADKSVYMSLTEVQAMLGHSHVTIMKIDIEGFEYDALQEWRDTDNLPDQLLLEYHYGLPARTGVRTVDTVGEMSLFMMHLANLGYAVMGAEHNPYGGGCCAELGLLRVEAVHPVKLMGKPGPRLRGAGSFEEYM